MISVRRERNRAVRRLPTSLLTYVQGRKGRGKRNDVEYRNMERFRRMSDSTDTHNAQNISGVAKR